MESKDSREYFMKYLDLTTREAYDYYRKNRKKPSETIDQYNYFVKAVKGIFWVIKELMLESEGGIYIDGLGYFCNLQNGDRMVDINRMYKTVSLVNRYQRKKRYLPYFQPYSNFEGWTMDGTFSKELRRKLNNRKHQYKVHFDIGQAYSISKHAQKVQAKDREFKISYHI